MHDLLRIGDIGFAPEELPRLEPYLPAPVGLALGGANLGTVIDLRPKHRKSSTTKRGRFDQRIVAAAAVAVVAFGGLTYMAHSSEASAQKKSDAAQAAEKKLRSQLYYLQQAPAQSGTNSVAALKNDVVTILAGDVQWQPLLSNLGLKLPPGVVLASFSGTHTIPTITAPVAPTTPVTTPAGSTTGSTVAGSTTAVTVPAAPAGPTVNNVCAGLTAPLGTIAMGGTAPDVRAVAALLDSLRDDTDLTTVWVSSVQQSAATAGVAPSVTFALSATLGSTARGHRLETFFKESKCK